jgi:hypothetical protein
MTSSAVFPTEVDPFLVQVVAVGVGPDLHAAIEEGKAGLRSRAGQMRQKAGFPIIHGLCFALTNVLTRVQKDGDTATTTATLAAWYQLDFERNQMTSLPHRVIGTVSTSVIDEHYVVFCEGYLASWPHLDRRGRCTYAGPLPLGTGGRIRLDSLGQSHGV